MNELIFRCVDSRTRALLIRGPAPTQGADQGRQRLGVHSPAVEGTWSLSLQPGSIQALNRQVLTSLGSLRFETHQEAEAATPGGIGSHGSNPSATNTPACILPCLTVLLPSRIELLQSVEPLAKDVSGEPAVGKFCKVSDLVYLVLVGQGIDDLLKYCEAHCIPCRLRDTEAFVLMLRRKNEPTLPSDTKQETELGQQEDLLPMTKKERELLLSELTKLGEESENLTVTVTEGEYEFQYTFA
jgi:hypothetical protein